MIVSVYHNQKKAIVRIKDKKIALPLNYVQYIFGGREMKPVPTINK
jgi:hypothetical protein